MVRILAVDTETTGLPIRHGCRPFTVTTCDNTGKHKAWEWLVDPHTRNAIIPASDIVAINRYFTKFDQFVFHNVKFDLHALASVGVELPRWDKLHDTLTMSHALDSAEPHGLKELSARYLGVPLSDQQDLQKIVVSARHKAKKLGWAIASPDHPHFRPARKKNDAAKSKAKGWTASDYWLPRQIALLPAKKNPLTDPDIRKVWEGVCLKYARLDAERTMRLFLIFRDALESEGLFDQYWLNMQAQEPLFAMECDGFPIRRKVLKPVRLMLQRKADENEKAAVEGLGYSLPGAGGQKGLGAFNLRSYKDMRRLLYDEWQLPVIKTTDSGNPSTDFETLLRLRYLHFAEVRDDIRDKANAFLDHVLNYSKFRTGANYTFSYDSNRIGDMLYPTTNACGTAHTRISFSDPNLQNISKGGAVSGIEDPELQDFLNELSTKNESLRQVFGPLPGRMWYDLDYSQLQLRIFATVAGEQSILDAFDRGVDAHTFVAQRIFKVEQPDKLQRRIGKNVNFGYIFGAQPAKIEQTAGHPGLWDIVTKMFPSAARFLESTKWQVKQRGYVSAGGYRLMVNQTHKGVNFIVAGLEGLIVKRAMIDCFRYIQDWNKRKNDDRRLALQVHDELIFDRKAIPDLQLVDGLDKDGKPAKLAVIEQHPFAMKMKRLMEQAGDKYGVYTPVDVELVTEQWNKSYPITYRQEGSASCRNPLRKKPISTR